MRAGTSSYKSRSPRYESIWLRDIYAAVTIRRYNLKKTILFSRSISAIGWISYKALYGCANETASDDTSSSFDVARSSSDPFSQGLAGMTNVATGGSLTTGSTRSQANPIVAGSRGQIALAGSSGTITGSGARGGSTVDSCPDDSTKTAPSYALRNGGGVGSSLIDFGVAVWFNCAREGSDGGYYSDTNTNTREELKRELPEFYELLSEVLPEDAQYEDCYFKLQSSG